MVRRGEHEKSHQANGTQGEGFIQRGMNKADHECVKRREYQPVDDFEGLIIHTRQAFMQQAHQAVNRQAGDGPGWEDP